MPLRSLRVSSVKSALYCQDSASQFSYSPVSTLNMISGSAIVCSAPLCQPPTEPPVVRMLKLAKSGLVPLAPPWTAMSVWLRGTLARAPAAAGAVVGWAGAWVGAAAGADVGGAGAAAGAQAARTPSPAPRPVKPNAVSSWRRLSRNLVKSDDSCTRRLPVGASRALLKPLLDSGQAHSTPRDRRSRSRYMPRRPGCQTNLHRAAVAFLLRPPSSRHGRRADGV